MNTNTNIDSKSKQQQTSGQTLWLAIILVLFGVVLGGSAVWYFMHHDAGSLSGEATPAKSPLYQCPMHPTITSDHQSDCPICGMKLVEVKQEQDSPNKPSMPPERRIKYYRSQMDPKQTSPELMKDEMGMDYIPVYEDDVSGNGDQQVQGLTTVTIDTARQQLIGLRTVPVTYGTVAGSWRTVGRVQIDPTRVRKINIKVEGYIENMYVDFVGRPVRKGEPLFSIYSPSLLATESEYLLALQTKDALSKGGILTADGDSLVVSARRKLELWDVPTKEIDRLEQTRQPSKSLTFLSPFAGVVTAKNVVEGARVNPGDTLYEITDLSVIWVLADAYEKDLPQVAVGMPASLTVQSYPNQIFEGKVAFIEPLLDPKTRTAKVHIHFQNPTGVLRPEMFGDVVLEGIKREGLRIPVDAVVRSGTEDVVFLSLGNGKFEPREVQLGATRRDQIEVVSGLAEGQEVVIGANFLVDSESQLRSSLSAIGGN